MSKSSAATLVKPSTKVDLSRFEPANRRRLSAPNFRTFLAIADLWGLSEEQRRLILGYPSRSAFHSWAKQAREHGEFTLDVDVLMRISAVLGIHAALGILFENECDGIAWLRGPRSEEHTSELQSLMRISYAVFCLKKKK